MNKIDTSIRFGRYKDVCQRYGIGRSTAIELVRRTGAGTKYGRTVIIDLQAIDKFFEELHQQQKAQQADGLEQQQEV